MAIRLASRLRLPRRRSRGIWVNRRSDLLRNSPLRYILLSVAFCCALAFQATVSATIWRDAQTAGGSVLVWLAILLNLHAITPFACLLLGFYVAGVRIWDPKAWLLLALLVCFSLAADGLDRQDPVMQWQTPLKHLALIYRSMLSYGWFICMLVFAIYFPERAGWDKWHPGLKWIVLLPAVAGYVLIVIERIWLNEGFGFQTPFKPVRHITEMIRAPMLYCCALISLAVLLAKVSSTRDADDRRRLRVLFAGLAASFLPTLIFEGLFERVLSMKFGPWVKLLAYSPLILFPVTVAYVTVVQRALDVRVILREGLQYAMARRGLIVFQIFDSVIVVLLVAFLSARMTFAGRVSLTAAGIALIFVIGAVVRRAAVRIDRRFFREAYRSEQILARLSESVGSVVELQPLLKTVATRIAEALHISEIAVFIGEQNIYQPAFAFGFAQPPKAVFPSESPVVKQLQSAKRAAPVYLDDPHSWAARMGGREHEELTRLRTQLLLPLARHDELLGFLSLGPRSAEAPYSPSDIDLLQSVAQQTALAIENSRLTSTIAAETAEREVIRRELAIAREVQQRLLPQTYPNIPGVQCCGKCRPAREVGGDYYDFLELPNEVLGVAIGDVSGKGIPASLLMASLQASLRGQTISGCSSLERLITNVNRLVYAASPSNRYATFFYAQLDFSRRALSYVNAGHNAPILLQWNNGRPTLLRLDVGGPPVGLLPVAQYQSASVELRGEDLIVLFTDGISEAMNLNDEEWGEERLIEAIQGSMRREPEAMIEAVFRSADEFTGTAPQHDDMTLVVLALNGRTHVPSRRST